MRKVKWTWKLAIGTTALLVILQVAEQHQLVSSEKVHGVFGGTACYVTPHRRSFHLACSRSAIVFNGPIRHSIIESIAILSARRWGDGEFSFTSSATEVLPNLFDHHDSVLCVCCVDLCTQWMVDGVDDFICSICGKLSLREGLTRGFDMWYSI